ncbi:ADP-ribosylglycohydrolase family protein, partial [Candidatus Bipolaricaulota bacterium]|nr:ADP-ribosylglycohydrolase family protein [Candidatus Bipolaricaulota bacterium]
EINEEKKMNLLLGRVSPSLSRRIEMALELVTEVEKDELPKELYEMVGTGVDTVEAIPASLAIFKASEGDPIMAVKYAANAGGDTDTIGAIAGAIVGSYAGIEAFPGSYLDRIEGVNDLGIKKYAEKLVELIDTELIVNGE